ncbi:MAG: type I DNA topoisomerase, partial [Muribaculaceae bacterium]|nr:type I DNA topoisomerase [Muribaculaceae bacterium]
MKNLVIVESPAKAKTIEKFLGKDYKVMSSYGHIRDLKKKNFSIDLDNNFSPIYEIPSDKTELVNELKKAAAQAETVWLASDEDREGEAIAWHLFETLDLKPENTKRIVFHEITKNAILNAIEHPRDIDINLVDAQQARRVIDRIVGFELSPVLWKKIKPALSAGRVQSVAVRLIVDREKEIKNFRSEEYFRLTADFTDPAGHQLHTELSHRLPSRPHAEEMLLKSASADFTVADITVKPVKKSPAPPFTTSPLQQEAARKLGFTVSQTMMVAQRLYEAGYITYMRTDSLNLSEMAVNVIADVVKNMLGPEYHHARRYHTKSKGAQEAHEAIRPTDATRESIEGTQQEKRLYTLIRRRAIASQMADAVIENPTIDIEATGQASQADKPARFIASGEVIKFDGFLKIYLEGRDDSEDEAAQGLLPKLNKGDKMTLVDMIAQQRYTQQPARYNEASLVKKMEELGIGRPSTYAPTISTIQQREYVERADREGVRRDLVSLRLADGTITETVTSEVTGSEKGKLVPTDIGMVVNDFLTDYFPTILDYNFTANIEQKFDEIAEGTPAVFTATPTVNEYKKAIFSNFDILLSPATQQPEPPVVDPEPDYTTGLEGVNIEGERYSSKLNVSSSDGHSIELIGLQSASDKSVYFDRSATTLTAGAGSTVTFTLTHGRDSWMHKFIYVDWDKNGFLYTDESSYIEPSGVIKPGVDLVNYELCFKDWTNHTDATLVNPQGQNVTGQNRSLNPNTPISITIPENTAAGTYRARFKLDWASLDPNGSKITGNTIKKNDGVIIDFTIEVVEAEPEPVHPR